MNDYIGAQWLIDAYDLSLAGALRLKSRLGTNRSERVVDGYTEKVFNNIKLSPESGLREHLRFHLKREIVNFELLARLFEKVGPSEIQDWVDAEPTGAYARRAAFLFEWMTGIELSRPASVGGAYVHVVDDSKLVAASKSHSKNNARWRVYDNMPGTRHFCPSIVKIDQVREASALDVFSLIKELEHEVGEDMIARAATWITERESRASFSIEREASDESRIGRFARAIRSETGKGEAPPLNDAALASLQKAIIGGETTLPNFGRRLSPVFVGEIASFEELVHYIAPPPEDVRGMLDGLLAFLQRTQGQSSIMRAAVCAFGFVYIHPLADGNGRMHRFLMNDILRRDGVSPENIIIPLSAAITDDMAVRREYDRVLETVSMPIMDIARPKISFAKNDKKYPDGRLSNLDFAGDAETAPSWHFPKMEEHVCFMSQIIEKAISGHMRMEATFLKRHSKGRAAIKDILDMPDPEADQILRSYRDQPRRSLTKKLLKEIPALAEKDRAQKIKNALDLVWRENPVHNERELKVFDTRKP